MEQKWSNGQHRLPLNSVWMLIFLRGWILMTVMTPDFSPRGTIRPTFGDGLPLNSAQIPMISRWWIVVPPAAQSFQLFTVSRLHTLNDFDDAPYFSSRATMRFVSLFLVKCLGIRTERIWQNLWVTDCENCTAWKQDWNVASNTSERAIHNSVTASIHVAENGLISSQTSHP